MTEQLLYLDTELRVHAYYWGESLQNAERIFVIAPGMPSYPEKEFFEAMPESLKKYAFVVVYYYGYWLSGGLFSTMNTSKSVVDCVTALRHGSFLDSFTNEQIEKYDDAISVVGYSFGANAVARTSDGLYNDVAEFLYISPLALVYLQQLSTLDTKELESFLSFNKNFAKFIDRGFREVVRNKDNGLSTYFAGRDPKSMVSISNDTKVKSKAYRGSNDKAISPHLFASFADLLGIDHASTVDGFGHNKSLIVEVLTKYEYINR